VSRNNLRLYFAIMRLYFAILRLQFAILRLSKDEQHDNVIYLKTIFGFSAFRHFAIITR
jgi:hypothetical protein